MVELESSPACERARAGGCGSRGARVAFGKHYQLMMTAAEILCDAIETHRDDRYHGGLVTDLDDSRLYDVAVWFRTWQDHALDPDAPIIDA